MSGKYALIIANTEYTDPGLAQLTAPGKDSEDFARVLKDQKICAFDVVKVLLNQPSSIVIEAIDEFFDQKKSDDLLVLYFSGHGVRDELGILYLAVKNSNRFRLRSTAIKSDFIREAMDQSRSKRQVLILDCCNSGAFAHGTKAATGVSIGTATAFEVGYGRIILTASDSTQFAWEGDKVIGKTENSLFTHYLVEGLKGQADVNGDGLITVDELYDYTYDHVRLATPKQTPSKFATKQQGEIVLGRLIRVKDIKSLMEHNINLRNQAALTAKSEPSLVERILSRVKTLQSRANFQPSSESSSAKESIRSGLRQVLLLIFWLLVVLLAIPFIFSLLPLHIFDVSPLFWGAVIIFGVIGIRRGWAQESLVTFSLIFALAVNHVLRRYVPAVANLSEFDVSLFWLRTLGLETLVYFGYQAGIIILQTASKRVREHLQNRQFGVILGAINGYLLAGTVLYYYHVADYPYPEVIAKPTDPNILQTVNALMIYMPPQLLGEPGIYFAVILVFMLILLIFI